MKEVWTRAPWKSRAAKALALDLVIAWRNVSRHARRSLFAGAAVTFGVIAIILAAGFIEWIYWAMREGTIRSGLGHLQVMPSGAKARGMSDPYAFVLPEAMPERGVVESAPHVVSVAPRLKFTGLVGLGDASLSFLAQGIDPDKDVSGQHAIIIEQGADLSAADPGGVLLGQGLARNLGAKVGDRVVLLVTKRGGALDGVEASVRGVFSSQTKAYDDVAIHVPYRLASETLAAGGAHAWVVYLDDTGRTARVAEELRRKLGAKLDVVAWFDATDFYHKTVELFSRQVLVMKLIIALVVVLSISNTMMMGVMERTDEIATTLALGVRRNRVLSRFLLEGVVIGLLGGALGIALGWVLAALISKIGIPMPPPPGMGRGFVGEIMMTADLARDAIVLAFCTALIASCYPAWRASRMVIAEALRHGR